MALSCLPLSRQFPRHHHSSDSECLHLAQFFSLPFPPQLAHRRVHNGCRISRPSPLLHFRAPRIWPSVAASRLEGIQAEQESREAQDQEEQEVEGLEQAQGSGEVLTTEEARTQEEPEVEGLEQAQGSVEAGPSVEDAKLAVGFYEGNETVALNKGKGAYIADILMVYGGLLDRPFGSGQIIAAAGAVVTERVKSEAEVLRREAGMDQQAIFELLRLVHLLEMDLQLVSAARKNETLLERLEIAKTHCRQAVLLANAL